MDITIEKIVVGEFQANCYVVACKKTGRGFIIDPGDEYERIKKVIDRMDVEPSFIVNTHGHLDHIKEDEKFHLPVYIHKQDAECLRNPDKNLSSLFGFPFVVSVETVLLEDGYILKIGETEFEVLHTPGHSPGSACLKSGELVFTGDTLFCGGYGRTDLPGGSEERLLGSIKNKLLVLPDETVIYPGHGPSSTIGAEKKGFF